MLDRHQAKFAIVVATSIVAIAAIAFVAMLASSVKQPPTVAAPGGPPQIRPSMLTVRPINGRVLAEFSPGSQVFRGTGIRHVRLIDGSGRVLWERDYETKYVTYEGRLFWQEAAERFSIPAGTGLDSLRLELMSTPIDLDVLHCNEDVLSDPARREAQEVRLEDLRDLSVTVDVEEGLPAIRICIGRVPEGTDLAFEYTVWINGLQAGSEHAYVHRIGVRGDPCEYPLSIPGMSLERLRGSTVTIAIQGNADARSDPRATRWLRGRALFEAAVDEAGTSTQCARKPWSDPP